MHRLIVVRHGNTFEAGEETRRIGSTTNAVLTQAGRAQATAVGRHFRERGIMPDRVMSGPLLRTRVTAALIVAEIAGAPKPSVAEFLDEIDHGPDENASEAAVVSRIGEAGLRAWDEQGICPPGWSDDREARLAAWTELRALKGVSLLVTSSGAARFALLAFQLSRPSLRLRTGAWGMIVLDDERATLNCWDVRPSRG